MVAPVSLNGVTQACPECREVVTWSLPRPDEVPAAHTINVACEVCAACAAVTMLLPLAWLLSIPLSVAAIVLGVNAIRTYRATLWVWAAVGGSTLILISGLVRADELNEALRQLGQQK